MVDYSHHILELLESSRIHLSTIKPSDWTEQNMIMPKPFPGPFRYDKTPYTREIIDCLAPDHPARIISVMKGAQIGFSSGVIYPGIGWIIKNQPGNTYLSVGSPDLIEKSMEKIDLMIDACGIRNLIKPQVQRNKAGKTGDTNLKKEFAQGYVTVNSANNHKGIRQVDLQYIFIDDMDAIKRASKESGNTRKLIEQRAAAYADKSKIFYISTPEIRPSNIEEVYLLGDQRKYLIPCPHCGEAIELQWSVPIDEKEMGGITWKTDIRGRLIKDSVGYVCQKCSKFFTDSNKDTLLNAGFWNPTALPSREGNYSYHISSLYAPAGMYDWAHYVGNFIDACPEGQPRKEGEYKVHCNLCLGEPYEEVSEAIKANELQKNNIRSYDVANVPEKLSESDGNGKIVLLTCAVDLNGIIEDARVDYEIIGWSETGSVYAITHGSIGTFIPREGDKKVKEDREKWTYEHNQPNSVWPVLENILGTVFTTDTGRDMKIFITGLDTGHYTKQAYSFVDSTNNYVVALKGKDVDKFVKLGVDNPTFKVGKERSNLFLVEVNEVKDNLSELIRLKWMRGSGVAQPPGYLNFPTPSDNQYLYKNFFAHYEAEERKIIHNLDGSVSIRWVKKTSNAQNHMWDVMVYNLTVRDILLYEIGKEYKIQKLTWAEFVSSLLGR